MKVVIATDSPAFNIDTFLLARRLGGDSLQPVGLDTFGYDAISKRSLEEGLRRIDAADYVLFLRSGHTPGADWQRAHCERAGILLDSKISPDTEVFKISKARVP